MRKSFSANSQSRQKINDDAQFVIFTIREKNCLNKIYEEPVYRKAKRGSLSNCENIHMTLSRLHIISHRPRVHMYLSKWTDNEIHYRKQSRGMDAASKTRRVLSRPSFVQLLFCHNLNDHCVPSNKRPEVFQSDWKL